MKELFWRGEKAYDNAVEMDLARGSDLALDFAASLQPIC
jgi:hypothetical protein